jgi:hypothetical protein
MAQYIKQGNIFGRIGSGVGKGLAEQLPKEIERGRLASGLQSLEGQKDLSPFQQFARLSAIPGVTPQMIQSGTELLRQQQIRDAYKRGRNPRADQVESSTPFSVLKNIQNPIGNNFNSQLKNPPKDQTIPSDVPRREEALQNPPAAAENPLNEKFIPASPWTQQMQEDAINEAFDRGIARTFDEANAYANSQRQLREQTPEKYREQLDYQKGVDREVDNLFDKHLQTRLQKEGKETFSDVPGDLQLNIKKKARNSVATGQMNPEQAAEYYSKKALDLVKNKGEALRIANRDVWDRLLPHKKEEAIKKLDFIAQQFSDMGSDEDFFNFLTTDELGADGRQLGMGLSPGGAALIQYRRTGKVKNLIKNTKISNKNAAESTRDFAQNLFKEMTPKDSFLAIARQMKQQDPNFDEYAFFDYLRENQDQYGSNERLKREVSKGVSDFFPNWRDIGLFPAFEKSVAND